MPTYRLTKRCRIERRKTSRNDFEPGDTSGEPALVCHAWAEIEHLTANEQVVAQQLFGNSTHRIVIRWPHRLIEPMHWVVANDVRYQISGVRDLGGQYLEIMAAQEQTGIGTVTTR